MEVQTPSSWAIFAHFSLLGSFFSLLGASWAHCTLRAALFVALGWFFHVLDRLGPFLVPSWGCLGASWRRLGAIWGRLGTLLGVSWGVLGASWGVLAAKTQQERGPSLFWGPLGAVWGSFFGGFWVIFGMIFQYFSYLILKYLNMS